MRRISAWSIVMLLTWATSAHAVVLFTDGFETYTGSNNPLDANFAGPNAGPNGGPGNPWFGPLPPNLRVVGAGGGLSSGAAGPHSGSQMVTASALSDVDQDWVNIANRFNSGSVFTGNLSLDWWFYDPTGAGNSSYRDYVALGNYTIATTAASSGLDYTSTSNGNLNTGGSVLQRLSLGATVQTGSDNTKYQARVVGATDGTASGNWFNVGTRSVGWHEGTITLGTPNGASTVVSFYIDGVDVLDHAFSTNSIGVNVIELNAGFNTTSANFDDLRLSSGLLGDFNNDGSVDAADYVVLREGTTFTPNDYAVWRTNFGQPTGSGSLANSAVPEPGTLVLLLVGMLAKCCCRRAAVS